ncbi:hypothetical protein J6590_085927 [Homalodisca vitripennis]|nr:hypothetical protein J6590_085927 [Homalodisca vitripennis]
MQLMLRFLFISKEVIGEEDDVLAVLLGWKCKRCSEESYEKSIKDIKDLQNKIHNLSIEENLDHETSVTLAAELGSALLKEIFLLKQQLHDQKETKSENLLELEDRLKEDLDSKTIYFKKETDRLQLEITALRDTEVVLRTELESRNSLIHSVQTNCQELVLKLDEQQCTIRAYLQSLVVHTKSHLNMKLSSNSTTPYKKNSISVLQPPTIYESSRAPPITKTLDTPFKKKPAYIGMKLHNHLPSELREKGEKELKPALHKWLAAHPFYSIEEFFLKAFDT